MSRSYLPLLLGALLTAPGCIPEGDAASETPAAADATLQDALLFMGTESTGRRDLYRIQADGTNLVNLTQTLESLGEGWSLSPIQYRLAYTPSPSGREVLIMAAHDRSVEAPRLYRVDTETGASTLLTELPTGVSQVRYSLDGAAILVETKSESGLESAVFRLDEGGLVALGPAGTSLSLDGFFPDGERALVRLGQGTQRRLASLEIATGALSPLGETAGMEVIDPSVSPAGDAILFQGWAQGQRCADIFKVSVPSRQDAPSTDEDGSAPVPLGLAQAAWVAIHGGEVPGDHQPGDDPDEPVTPGEPPVDLAGPCLPVSAPSFSPDGSGQIAFLATSDLETGREDLFITTEGGALRSPSKTLGDASDRGVAAEPLWSPQGGASLFTFTGVDATLGEERTLLYWGSAAPEELAQYGAMTQGYAGNPTLAHWDGAGERVLFWTQGASLDAVLVDAAGGNPQAITQEVNLEILYPLWLQGNTLFY